MEVFLFGFPDFNSIRLVYGGGVIRHTGFYKRVIGSAFSFHRTKTENFTAKNSNFVLLVFLVIFPSSVFFLKIVVIFFSLA